MLQAKLIVVGGEVKAQELKLKLPTVIGRGKEANLKVPLALVSRKHCEIREREGRLFIRDLGSLNGTFVNNYKITNEQPLLPGELITIGTVTFRADYQLSAKTVRGVERTGPGNNSGSPLEPSVNGQQTPIDCNPVFSEQVTARVPTESLPAPALDATVAGVTPESSPTSSRQAVTESTHCKEKALPAASPVCRDQHDVLDDFTLETTPQKSISLSALNELRFDAPRQVSFIGDLNFGTSAPAPANESVRIDLGKNEPANAVSDAASDKRLDSFLRRIAKTSD